MTSPLRANAIVHAAFAAALFAALAGVPVRAAEPLPKNLVVNPVPKPVAPIEFKDQSGKSRNLNDFKGKVVVLNFWATWCVPCRKEMPTLDRLQAALGGQNFEVVPVSIDLGGIDAVRKFFVEIRVHNLAMYVDTSGQGLREVGAFGLPTTLILDRNGQEIGRIVGPAEWDSAEMVHFLTRTIAERNSSTAQTQPSRVAEANKESPGFFQRGLQWLRALVGK